MERKELKEKELRQNDKLEELSTVNVHNALFSL